MINRNIFNLLLILLTSLIILFNLFLPYFIATYNKNINESNGKNINPSDKIIIKKSYKTVAYAITITKDGLFGLDGCSIFMKYYYKYDYSNNNNNDNNNRCSSFNLFYH